MAMKIVGEYSLEKVTPKNFELRGGRGRTCQADCETTCAGTGRNDPCNAAGIGECDPVVGAVAALIGQRCERAMNSFRR